MSVNPRELEKSWEVFIDTGGTFTDCLARDPDGFENRVKVLSSGALRGRIVGWDGDRRFRFEAPWSGPDDFLCGFEFRLLGSEQHVRVTRSRRGGFIDLANPPHEDAPGGSLFELLSPEEAPLLATRLLTGAALGDPLPQLTMRLATTRGTNALLTDSGASPILFITEGFRDLLEIGTQARPDLFALKVMKRRLIQAAVVEVCGRLDAAGKEITPLDLSRVETAASQFVERGHRTAAVALLHADKNPVHEQLVASCLKRAGFEFVSCSAELAPFIKILIRAETAVVDAYLSPVINSYLEGINRVIKGGDLLVMTSAGGLVSAGSFCAKDSLLSGPAGGIAGAAAAGRAAEFERVIAFDMGGTSTDVARYDGDFEYVFDCKVGDAHLAAPTLAIESVAAGGGSICGFDGTRLVVGPESAGAHPGPACYGAGGPLTITDVNLLCGRIDPERFEIPIRTHAAEQSLEAVRRSMAAETGESPARDELLEGFLEIANQRMADAIRGISLRVGYDPEDYALVAFGGAGPQHAVAVAERLGAKIVLIPAHPGLLSAQGLAGAVVERFSEQQILKPLDEIEPMLPEILDRLSAEAKELLARDGIDRRGVVIRRTIAGMRFAGQDSTLEVDVHHERSLDELFNERFLRVFGHLPEGRSIELVSLRVVASTQPKKERNAAISSFAYSPDPSDTTRMLHGGCWVEVPVYERGDLRPGATLAGPCLVFERYSACVFEPGWSVEVGTCGALISRRTEALEARRIRHRPEAVRLELFTHRFETIAREMGESLRRTAVSTNIKERLDFSCAVLDAEGELVVNAPHIPVHLGSLGLCVRSSTEATPLGPGDAVVTNHPAFGGSHLPDVTLVSAAFDQKEKLIGYVASRAHHAEIGGCLPGSMPPTATRLVEEGVVIPPTYLARAGATEWDRLRRVFNEAPYPTRAIEDNLADLRAAYAANLRGVAALERLASDQGREVVAQYMAALKDQSELSVRAALRRIADGEYRARAVLDDGAVLAVRINLIDDRVALDFSGSSGVHPGNLNATPAIVRSAVLYVLRLLIDEPLPLNEGLMRTAELTIPRGILNPPFGDVSRAPAVVGGNVETSQRLVNALVRALGLAAASQGTMNNLLFGNDALSYYETVCGGCGAGPGFKGASAVHSHMTNTRITDPEVIEHRYPVRLRRFQIRRGSGGAGEYYGGDGVLRELEFLAPMSLSILSQHRCEGPAGIAGGASGRPGCQQIITSAGEKRVLEAVDSCEMNAGDRLVLETPGGGGYGTPGDGSS